jgi:hypothetical protein
LIHAKGVYVALHENQSKCRLLVSIFIDNKRDYRNLRKQTPTSAQKNTLSVVGKYWVNSLIAN